VFFIKLDDHFVPAWHTMNDLVQIVLITLTQVEVLNDKPRLCLCGPYVTVFICLHEAE